MRPDEIADLVRAHVAALSARDVPLVLAGLASDVVWESGPERAVGTEAVARMLRTSLRGQAPELELVDLLIGGGDSNRAAAELHEVHMVWGNRRRIPIVGLFTVGADGTHFTRVKVYREGGAQP